MIVLKVEDYCHNCPDFEADVDTQEYTYHAFDVETDIGSSVVTSVQCKYRYRCAAQMKYLETKKRVENKQGV